jgi:hypothetical protein
MGMLKTIAVHGEPVNDEEFRLTELTFHEFLEEAVASIRPPGNLRPALGTDVAHIPVFHINPDLTLTGQPPTSATFTRGPVSSPPTHRDRAPRGRVWSYSDGTVLRARANGTEEAEAIESKYATKRVGSGPSYVSRFLAHR